MWHRFHVSQAALPAGIYSDLINDMFLRACTCCFALNSHTLLYRMPIVNLARLRFSAVMRFWMFLEQQQQKKIERLFDVEVDSRAANLDRNRACDRITKWIQLTQVALWPGCATTRQNMQMMWMGVKEPVTT